jgi:hypothetical protein
MQHVNAVCDPRGHRQPHQRHLEQVLQLDQGVDDPVPPDLNARVSGKEGMVAPFKMLAP